MVKIKAKYRKRTTRFGKALVGVRSEIEKSTHFGRALVSVRAKIEKNTNFGTTLVRIKSEIVINTFLVGLWLELWQK